MSVPGARVQLLKTFRSKRLDGFNLKLGGWLPELSVSRTADQTKCGRCPGVRPSATSAAWTGALRAQGHVGIRTTWRAPKRRAPIWAREATSSGLKQTCTATDDT